MALSALDFPFCFLAVRLVGTERIGELEHAVVGRFKKWVLEPLKGTVGLQAAEQGIESGKEAVEQKKEVGWGVEEAQEALDNGNASEFEIRVCSSYDQGEYGWAYQANKWRARNSSMDAVGSRVCDSQELHLHSSTVDGCRDTASSQDAEELGLEDWKSDAEDDVDSVLRG